MLAFQKIMGNFSNFLPYILKVTDSFWADNGKMIPHHISGLYANIFQYIFKMGAEMRGGGYILTKTLWLVCHLSRSPGWWCVKRQNPNMTPTVSGRFQPTHLTGRRYLSALGMLSIALIPTLWSWQDLYKHRPFSGQASKGNPDQFVFEYHSPHKLASITDCMHIPKLFTWEKMEHPSSMVIQDN